jgi:hypothetical protein
VEKRSHDYIRHGTITLFAALENATCKVTDACYPRYRPQEFLKFLRQAATAYPCVPAAHRVRQLRHPHSPHGAGVAGQGSPGHLAFHADDGIVAKPGGDLLFDHHPSGDPPRQVKDLIAAIENLIDGWNDRCHPFTWTKAAVRVDAPRPAVFCGGAPLVKRPAGAGRAEASSCSSAG